MSARVTNITGIRTASRRREMARSANSRLTVIVLVSVGILTIIGLGATLSASSVPGLVEANDRLLFFKKQVMWVALGGIAMAVAARVPYDLYRRFSLPIFVTSLAGLVAVLFVGISDGGAQRWILVGPITVQPSEIAKFASIVFLAATLARKQALLGDFMHFIVPVVATAGTTALLIMLEPDLGTTIVIGAAIGAVLVASEAPLVYTFATGLVGAGFATMLALLEPYRLARVKCFLDPYSDPLGQCFQQGQSLLALGSGRMFGVGLAASRARWLYLPNAHTDFIFAIMGEETGFAGAVMVLVLFLVFSIAGIVIAHRAADPFGRMLAAGITAWLAVQAIGNIGGVVGVMPSTGIALPFISVGGSAMIMALGAVGVLLNIASSGKSKVRSA